MNLAETTTDAFAGKGHGVGVLMQVCTAGNYVRSDRVPRQVSWSDNERVVRGDLTCAAVESSKCEVLRR